MKLKNLKIVSYGNGYGFYIPKAFFERGVLQLGQDYDITIEISETTPKQENASE